MRGCMDSIRTLGQSESLKQSHWHGQQHQQGGNILLTKDHDVFIPMSILGL